VEGEKGSRALAREVKKMRGEEGLNFVDKPLFRTPLFDATWRGHEVIVKDLLSLQASVNVGDYQLRTPLHEAAYYGHLHIAEMLVENKADLEAEDNWSQTPLFRAVESDRADVVEYLVKLKAKTNHLDSDAVTVQHLASFNGNAMMSRWLFYQGAWKNRFAKEEGAAGTKPGEAEEEKAPDAEKEKKEENPDAVQGSPDASPQHSP
jgi:ankyrin repeat protein